ncbi:MAG: 16S rRNA (cytosine(1402)-N(4))-methyltransferase RsmH [Bacilli bacterium]|jgi:16S rRNA (cytosine1402-N4)-methyltransferase
MGDHTPVLLQEAVAGLDVKPDGIYVDMTFGRGGHTKAILDRLTTGRVYAIDRDIQAIEAGQALVASHPQQLTLIHANFTQVRLALAEHGVDRVDGILMDLGVSSPQFDDPDRGFSYREDAPLDMRMDRRQTLTAAQLVATRDVGELTRIFRDYADEPQAYQIAKAIVKDRGTKPLLTTGDLVALIKRVKPQKELSKKGHPAKQAFQALRIAVNNEIENLETALKEAVALLKPRGRLAVITFHSGEDRLVKNYFKSLCVSEGTRHGLAAMVKTPELAYEYHNRQPIVPGETEANDNHRAVGAKLRIIIRK